LHALVRAFHLADFRRHEQRALPDHAVPGQLAAAAMHQFAAERAAIQAAGHAVAEPEQKALLQGGVRHGARGGVEALAPGEVQELLEERADLPGRGGVDAQAAAGFGVEIPGGDVLPDAPEQPEIAAGADARQFLAAARDLGVRVAQKQVAALGQGGQQAGLVDAAILLRRQQHAGVARVQREGEHLSAQGREAGGGAGPVRAGGRRERAQVGEQFLGVGQGLFLGRLEPAEGAQVFDAGGFQGQDDFGQVQALDFGQFPRRAVRMFRPRP